MKTQTVNIAHRIGEYMALLSRASDRPEDVRIQLEAIQEQLDGEANEAALRCEILARSVNVMMSEWRNSTRRKNSLFSSAADADDDWREDFLHSTEGKNFLMTAYSCTVTVSGVIDSMRKIVRGLSPDPSAVAAGKGVEVPKGHGLEDMQRMHFIAEMNSPAIISYVEAALQMDSVRPSLGVAAEQIESILEGYWRQLVKRHSVDGIEIHESAVMTDVAMHIYENVDAEGEIEMGKSPDEMSAYSRRKAQSMAEAIRDPFVHELMTSEGGIMEYVRGNLDFVHTCAERLGKLLEKEVQGVKALVSSARERNRFEDRRYSRALVNLEDLDPSAVPYKAKAGILTQDERFREAFRNETLGKIVRMLKEESSAEEIVSYVLERRDKIRKHFQEENSFYTCQIGAGNPFLGLAPGALQIVPSSRPLSRMEDIVGTGFEELKAHVGAIKGSSRWHSLFTATSPSKSADKNNILLIGPQGCGKSEAMRAIAAEGDSISIFASGSDFKTCWKDESLKNPKRLFEHAVRLQKETKKQVHLLLDEADAVLCKREYLSYGDDDLTTEFQILMDGLVSYKGVTVWAATNHPEKIPIPIIRRFSQVLIVGELSGEDRVHLLRKFFSFLPLSGVGDDDWRAASSKLDGATGDVIRKVADSVWRSKMQTFVTTMPDEAEEVVAWLESDGPFMVSSMTAERREKLIAMLAEHWTVGSRDIREAVDSHMKSVAIRTEIATARQVYENAKKVVLDMTGGAIVL